MLEQFMKSTTQNTPLMRAIKRGNETAVKVLLARGSEVNFQDGSFKIALFLAAEEGHISIAELSLKAGADPRGEKHDESEDALSSRYYA
ncbi:hypothetical protein V8C42DRAFT_326408 [Trichoderma barbatum]